MNILGIDPGKSGGLAIVENKVNQIPRIVKAIKNVNVNILKTRL